MWREQMTEGCGDVEQMTEGCGDVEGLRANDRGVWRFGGAESK